MVLRQLPAKVFCAYAHEDKDYCQQLETHLSVLKRQGLITFWHDREIPPGSNWAKTIDTHLETASIILLLISADFVASDYCYGVEMKRALERYDTNEVQVIPIVVRPCHWLQLPIGKLQALPADANPISEWTSIDNAWTQVVAGIRHMIENPSFLESIVSLSSSFARLVLDDLGIDSPLWDRVHYLRFTLSNLGDGILFVDSILLRVLKATPCNLLRPPIQGAILKMFEFEIDLEPNKTSYVVTNDFFAYKKGDIDGFRVKLNSKYDYIYEICVDVKWHSVSDSQHQVVSSKIYTVPFYIRDASQAIKVVESLSNTDSEKEDANEVP